MSSLRAGGGMCMCVCLCVSEKWNLHYFIPLTHLTQIISMLELERNWYFTENLCN